MYIYICYCYGLVGFAKAKCLPRHEVNSLSVEIQSSNRRGVDGKAASCHLDAC